MQTVLATPAIDDIIDIEIIIPPDSSVTQVSSVYGSFGGSTQVDIFLSDDFGNADGVWDLTRDRIYHVKEWGSGEAYRDRIYASATPWKKFSA